MNTDTELAALRARVAELERALREIRSETRNDDGHVNAIACSALARAESATPAKLPDAGQLAELLRDKERLDWLSDEWVAGNVLLPHDAAIAQCQTARGAIDAARKA